MASPSPASYGRPRRTDSNEPRRRIHDNPATRGHLLDIRKDISLRRKIIELWNALQLERHYTKEEILEQYLNREVMGPGVYGVEAASKYFFGHSAKEDSLAESAILAIQLSSPAKYDPYRNPQNASVRSKEILDQMVKLGYATKAEADASYHEFWDNFDYTRTTRQRL